MSGSTLEITYADAEVQKLAQRMGRVLGQTDTRELMQGIGVLLVSQTGLRFQTGTGPGGQQWEKSLAAQEEGRQTLIKTGRLRDSINSDSPHITNTSVEVGTNVEYSAIHQFGGTIKRKARQAILHFRRNKKGQGRFSTMDNATYGMKVNIGKHIIKMPACPFLGVDSTDEALILDLTDTWIKQKLGTL